MLKMEVCLVNIVNMAVLYLDMNEEWFCFHRNLIKIGGVGVIVCFSFNHLWLWWLSWPWSYGSWIYNWLCNQYLSPLMLWVRISIRVRCTTLCGKFCQWLATGQWFSPGPPVSSTNKTDRHDITEMLLKEALNTIKQTTNNLWLWIYLQQVTIGVFTM
jgi:hypothetical protein